MAEAPSTIAQAALLIVLVLPGITYQFLRERWRGPVPAERDLGQRVLRAIAASVVLDACYVLIAGPELSRLVNGGRPGLWGGIPAHLRLVGFVGLVLLVVVPALAAVGMSWLGSRRSRARVTATPTAWDHAFRDRGPCFVRARLDSGDWVGGWYGTRSFATAYPQDAELFLQRAFRMNADGSFGDGVQGSDGIYVRGDHIDVLEFLAPEPES